MADQSFHPIPIITFPGSEKFKAGPQRTIGRITAYKKLSPTCGDNFQIDDVGRGVYAAVGTLTCSNPGAFSNWSSQSNPMSLMSGLLMTMIRAPLVAKLWWLV